VEIEDLRIFLEVADAPWGVHSASSDRASISLFTADPDALQSEVASHQESEIKSRGYRHAIGRGLASRQPHRPAAFRAVVTRLCRSPIFRKLRDHQRGASLADREGEGFTGPRRENLPGADGSNEGRLASFNVAKLKRSMDPRGQRQCSENLEYCASQLRNREQAPSRQ